MILANKRRWLTVLGVVVLAYWLLVIYMVCLRQAFSGDHIYIDLVLLAYFQHVLFAYAGDWPMFVSGSPYLDLDDEENRFARPVRLLLFVIVAFFSLWFLYAKFDWTQVF